MSHTHTCACICLWLLVSWWAGWSKHCAELKMWLVQHNDSAPQLFPARRVPPFAIQASLKEMNIIQCVGFAFLLDPFHVVFWLTEKRSLKVTQPRWHRSGTIKSRENWEEANLNLFRTLVKESVRLSTFGWTRYLYLSEYLAVYHYFIYLNITTVYITYHSSSPNWAWPCSDAWDVCASFVCRRKGQAGTG